MNDDNLNNYLERLETEFIMKKRENDITREARGALKRRLEPSDSGSRAGSGKSLKLEMEEVKKLNKLIESMPALENDPDIIFNINMIGKRIESVEKALKNKKK